jgi:hypothetical protein
MLSQIVVNTIDWSWDLSKITSYPLNDSNIIYVHIAILTQAQVLLLMLLIKQTVIVSGQIFQETSLLSLMRWVLQITGKYISPGLKIS